MLNSIRFFHYQFFIFWVLKEKPKLRKRYSSGNFKVTEITFSSIISPVYRVQSSEMSQLKAITNSKRYSKKKIKLRNFVWSTILFSFVIDFHVKMSWKNLYKAVKSLNSNFTWNQSYNDYEFQLEKIVKSLFWLFTKFS